MSLLQSEYTEIRERLKSLIKSRAYIQLETPIKLSSGAMSSAYFDGKQILMFPEYAELFAKLILHHVHPKTIDAVGGMVVGADPAVDVISHAAWTHYKVNLPGFYVRKEPKKHGLQKLIEGKTLRAGMNVLIVDDVVTQGGAVMQAMREAEKAGAKIAKVACLVDREEGGSAKIKAAGYDFLAIFTKSELEA